MALYLHFNLSEEELVSLKKTVKMDLSKDECERVEMTL